jgi:hypothetical protein
MFIGGWHLVGHRRQRIDAVLRARHGLEYGIAARWHHGVSLGRGRVHAIDEAGDALAPEIGHVGEAGDVAMVAFVEDWVVRELRRRPPRKP